MTTFDAEGEPVDESPETDDFIHELLGVTEEDIANWPPPYRDGKVHVMESKCSTCVFRGGNLMHLPPGKLKGMAEHVQETGIPFSCHQTLAYSESRYREHYQGMALCAGAVENYGEQSVIMRMAHAMDVIVQVEKYPSSPISDRPADTAEASREASAS